MKLEITKEEAQVLIMGLGELKAKMSLQLIVKIDNLINTETKPEEDKKCKKKDG
jgi:hypothetical protein